MLRAGAKGEEEAAYLGPWQEFGATSLSFLEYQLIALGHALYPSFLLNVQGVNRK